MSENAAENPPPKKVKDASREPFTIPLEFPNPPPGITDVTSRKICKTFDQYIYLYEVMAQLSRLAYCDSGFIKIILDNFFGKNNNIVMNKIQNLDSTFRKKKFTSLVEQKDSMLTEIIPHESYAMGRAPDTKKHNYGTYIATHEALTAFVIDTTVANGILLKESKEPKETKESKESKESEESEQPKEPKQSEQSEESNESNEPKGPFEPTDIIISFKGTNTFTEVLHDLKSMIMRVDLIQIALTLGFSVFKEDKDSLVNGSFANILMGAWDVLIQAITKHSGEGEFRLFCTGHSLGGAYCTLFGFILGYLKDLPARIISRRDTANKLMNEDSPTYKLLKRIKSIHIISLGAPTLCADKARNVFNKSLISGTVTYDRLVTQTIPTLTSHTVGTDIIPLLPYFFTHPGFKQAMTSFKQDKYRPYKLSSIGNLYGVKKKREYKIKEPSAEVKKELEQAQKEGGKSTTEGGKSTTPQKGGGVLNIFKGKQKLIYEKLAVNHTSTFISVPSQGVIGTLVPHVVYFGLEFYSGLRLPGMKNPVPPKMQKCAYFGFYDDPTAGVLIKYINCAGRKITGSAYTRKVTKEEKEILNTLNKSRKNIVKKAMNEFRTLRRRVVSSPFLGGSKTRRKNRSEYF